MPFTDMCHLFKVGTVKETTIIVNNAFIVIIGAIVLGVGLYFALRIIGILRIYGLARH